MDFSIIVPVKNEAGNVKPLVEAIDASLRESEFQYEVIFVDGASTDGTQENVAAHAADYPVRLVDQQTETGLAGACLDGVEAAQADVIVIMDGDLSHPASALPNLVEAVLGGHADLAVGSRYVKGGKTVGWPWHRKLASRVATLLAWPLVDIADPMAGFFCTSKKNFLDGINSDTRGYKVLLEILVKLGPALRVKEVPISFSDRTYGETKLGSKVIRDYLEQLFRLSGALVTWKSSAKFGAVGLMGMVVDITTVSLVMHYFRLNLRSAHLFGFILAALFNYTLNLKWAFRKPGVDQHGIAGKYARFLFVSVNSLLFRSGIILLLKSLGAPDSISLFAGIAGVALANYAGYSLFVFNESPPWMKSGLQFRVLAIIVIAYLILLRAIFLGTIELIPEEAYYWNYSRHLALGYYDHPPLTAWLIKAGTSIFGTNPVGVRFFFFISWLVMAYYVFQLCRRWYGKTAGVAAVALLSANPFYFGAGFLAMTDILVVTAWTAALYYFWRAGVEDDAASWWKLGVVIGIGLLAKYTMFLFAPVVVLVLLLNKDSRKWFACLRPYLAAILALLIFAPVVYWNWQHDFVSFKFQFGRLESGGLIASKKKALDNLLMLLAPTLIIPLFSFSSFIFKRLKQDRRAAVKELFIAVSVLVPLLVFIKSAFFTVARVNWTLPVFVPVFLVAGYLLSPKPGMIPWKSLRSKVAMFLFLFLVLLNSIALNYLSGKIEILPYPKKMADITGWEELAEKVAVKYAGGVQSQHKNRVIAVMGDKYRIASELEYHFAADDGIFEKMGVSKPDIVSQNFFGKKGLMYGIWYDPKQYAGRDFLVITSKKKTFPEIKTYFRQVDRIETIDLTIFGKKSGEYYLVFGSGYTPSHRESFPVTHPSDSRESTRLPVR